MNPNNDETLGGRGEYEITIHNLKGSGLPEVMEINGYKESDVDKLMSQGLGELANVYQNNLRMAMKQIEAQREAGIVHPITVHTAMDAMREIGKITGDRGSAGGYWRWKCYKAWQSYGSGKDSFRKLVNF